MPFWGESSDSEKMKKTLIIDHKSRLTNSLRELLSETERGPVFLRLVEIKHEVDLDTLAESLGQPAALVRRHIQYMADQDILDFDDENRTVKLKD